LEKKRGGGKKKSTEMPDVKVVPKRESGGGRGENQ